jgi:16S rRNA (cytosine967-C5)-methyltransferase
VYALRVNKTAGITVPDLLQELQQLEGVQAEASPNLPQDFVRVQSGLQTILQAGLLARGLATVQDEATGLVVQMVGVEPGQRILDACAAPGGKTLYMASQLQGKVRSLLPWAIVDGCDCRL